MAKCNSLKSLFVSLFCVVCVFLIFCIHVCASSTIYIIIIIIIKGVGCRICQKSLSEASKPETPTNGVTSLSLTVANEPLMPRSEDVTLSDNGSSACSPLSPSGASCSSASYCKTLSVSVVSEMTYYVSSGMLNPTHSLTPLNVSVPFISQISRAKQTLEIKWREYQLQDEITTVFRIVWFQFAKIEGAKIILNAKSPTFRAAKLKGFTVPGFITECLW